jgi:integrase
LRWKDVDFLDGRVKVKRGFVDGIEGDTKSEASRSSVPLKEEVLEMLKTWRQLTSHHANDYVFTAQSNRSGKERRHTTPLCLTRYFVYHIQPVADELGIKIWRFGWHSFRRTFVTWLAAVNDNPKTVMELARHASINVTMKVYAELEKDKGREAHAKGLARLEATLKHYSQSSLCVANINSQRASDGIN